eukprot:COSAG05_NODE_5066_length_1273_cov_1.838160_2_plen_67_part_00
MQTDPAPSHQQQQQQEEEEEEPGVSSVAATQPHFSVASNSLQQRGEGREVEPPNSRSSAGAFADNS